MKSYVPLWDGALGPQEALAHTLLHRALRVYPLHSTG
jgi:hypothetical protein